MLATRYWRAVLNDPVLVTPRDESVWDHPQITFRHTIAITGQGGGTRYSPVGHCIYCGAIRGRLSDEHIVAYGLGGRLVLPKASCDACAANTGRVENNILRSALWAPRAQLKIQSRTRRTNGDTYPFTSIVDGKDVVVHLSIAQHPTMLFLCRLTPPRILNMRPGHASGVSALWVHTFGDPTVLTNAGLETFASPACDTVEMAQMLSKIAHGYAVAVVGESSFRPLLRTFIRRKFAKTDQYPECFNLVGGDRSRYAPSEDLHTLGHDIFDVADTPYLVVAIRLFSNLGGPVYRVVVGEML